MTVKANAFLKLAPMVIAHAYIFGSMVAVVHTLKIA
jgi:hypothetical protein